MSLVKMIHKKNFVYQNSNEINLKLKLKKNEN